MKDTSVELLVPNVTNIEVAHHYALTSKNLSTLRNQQLSLDP